MYVFTFTNKSTTVGWGVDIFHISLFYAISFLFTHIKKSCCVEMNNPFKKKRKYIKKNKHFCKIQQKIIYYWNTIMFSYTIYRQKEFIFPFYFILLFFFGYQNGTFMHRKMYLDTIIWIEKYNSIFYFLLVKFCEWNTNTWLYTCNKFFCFSMYTFLGNVLHIISIRALEIFLKIE